MARERKPMQLHMENLPRSVEITHGEAGSAFRYVDERLLPQEVSIVQTQDWREVVSAIKTLAVRGAPAIGLAGVMGRTRRQCARRSGGGGGERAADSRQSSVGSEPRAR